MSANMFLTSPERKMADIYFEKSNQDKKEKAAQIFTDNKTAKLPTY